MKKRFALVMSLLLVFACAIGLSACNTHKHNWSQDWQSDETHHWHACDGCDEQSDKAEHTINGDKCTVCGRGGYSLQYEISENGEYAICIGVKEGVQATEVAISDKYQGKVVKEIGSSALKDTQIGKITLPNTIETIGEYAFQGCTELKEIKIPNSVKTLGEGAFSKTGLQKITVPESVKTLGDFLFWECKNLTSAEIKSETVGVQMFLDCSELSQVTLTENVKGIGKSAFQRTKIEKITLPNSVETIGEYAFQGCAGLKEVNIPNSVNTLDAGAFSKTGLQQIIVPESVKTFGDFVFWGCTNLISAEIKSETVGVQMFLDCVELNQVKLSENVKTLGSYAFSGCTKLAEITLPNSLTALGNTVFKGCKELTSITIPDGITKIPINAFKNCTKLSQINFGKSVSEIAQSAFENTAIKNLVLPKTMKTVDNGAFSYSKIESVVVDSDLVDTFTALALGGAFINCAYLKEVTFTENVTTISAILSKSSIEKIVLPQSIEIIGESAFSGCNLLTSITLPENVKIIKSFAFENCGIQQLVLPKSIECIEKLVFANNVNLKKVVFPATTKKVTFITEFGHGIFANSSYPDAGVEEIVLEEGFKYDSESADSIFAKCLNLSKVTLPSDFVPSKGMFMNCSALNEIHYNGTRLDWLKHTQKMDNWYDIENDSFIYVPWWIPETDFKVYCLNDEVAGDEKDYKGELTLNESNQITSGTYKIALTEICKMKIDVVAPEGVRVYMDLYMENVYGEYELGTSDWRLDEETFVVNTHQTNYYAQITVWSSESIEIKVTIE